MRWIQNNLPLTCSAWRRALYWGWPQAAAKIIVALMIQGAFLVAAGHSGSTVLLSSMFTLGVVLYVLHGALTKLPSTSRNHSAQQEK